MGLFGRIANAALGHPQEKNEFTAALFNENWQIFCGDSGKPPLAAVSAIQSAALAIDIYSGYGDIVPGAKKLDEALREYERAVDHDKDKMYPALRTIYFAFLTPYGEHIPGTEWGIEQVQNWFNSK